MAEAKKNEVTVDPAVAEQEKHQKRRVEAKKQAIEDRKKRKEEVQVQIQDILFEFNGMESNVPVNHGYWDLVNQYKTLNKEDDAVFLQAQEKK